jgi:outer membrane murein-binding lipoprotein Lpp
MSRTAFHVVVFLVGLLAVCWIGIGYVSVHPLGAAVAAIIAACYIAGGVELYRYRQASNGLRSALNDLSSAKESLAPGWNACRWACATPCACAWKASAPPCPRRC